MNSPNSESSSSEIMPADSTESGFSLSQEEGGSGSLEDGGNLIQHAGMMQSGNMIHHPGIIMQYSQQQQPHPQQLQHEMQLLQPPPALSHAAAIELQPQYENQQYYHPHHGQITATGLTGGGDGAEMQLQSVAAGSDQYFVVYPPPAVPTGGAATMQQCPPGNLAAVSSSLPLQQGQIPIPVHSGGGEYSIGTTMPQLHHVSQQQFQQQPIENHHTVLSPPNILIPHTVQINPPQ